MILTFKAKPNIIFFLFIVKRNYIHSNPSIQFNQILLLVCHLPLNYIQIVSFNDFLCLIKFNKIRMISLCCECYKLNKA